MDAIRHASGFNFADVRSSTDDSFVDDWFDRLIALLRYVFGIDELIDGTYTHPFDQITT